MAAVMMKKLLKVISIGGFAAAIIGCPIADLSLKTTIKALAAPANVTSLKVSTGASNQFKLRWVDPSDKDVDHIEIDFKTPLSPSAPPSPVNVPVGVQAAIVTVPFNNVQYILTVKSVDKAGNKSPGAIYSPVSFWTALSSITGTPVPLLPVTSAPAQYQVTLGAAPPTTNYSAESDYTYGTYGVTQQRNYNFSPGKTETDYINFTYDSRGNLTRQEDFNTSNVSQWYYSYTYDNSNNQLTQTYYISGSLNTQHQYQYDANGDMIEDDEYNGSLTLTIGISYVYDSNGRLLGGTYIDYSSSPSQVLPISVTWDPNTGYPSNMTITYQGSPYIVLNWAASASTLTETVGFFGSTITETWSFDSHGDLSQISEPSGGTTYAYNYTYDSFGNMTQEVYSSNGSFSSGQAWGY